MVLKPIFLSQDPRPEELKITALHPGASHEFWDCEMQYFKEYLTQMNRNIIIYSVWYKKSYNHVTKLCLHKKKYIISHHK